MPVRAGRPRQVQPDERSAVDLDQLRVRLDRRDGLQVGLCRDFRDHDGAMTGKPSSSSRVGAATVTFARLPSMGGTKLATSARPRGSRSVRQRDGTPSRSTAASQTKCAIGSGVLERCDCPRAACGFELPTTDGVRVEPSPAQPYAKARQVAAAADRCAPRRARVGRRHPHQRQVRRAPRPAPPSSSTCGPIQRAPT